MIFVGLFLLEAGLCAINIYYALTTGSAFNWAVAAFCAAGSVFIAMLGARR